VNLHSGFDEIQFHVFDLPDLSDLPQIERSARLSLMAPSFPRYVNCVRTEVANSLEEIMEAFHIFLSDGYEGIIVRHVDAPYVRKRSTWVMKFKPKKADWYWVTGSIEEQDKYGNLKGTLGALVCRGDDGTEFRVGSGFTAAQRKLYWEQRNELPGQLCRVQYQHITPGKQVPRFPIFTTLERSTL
jgi:DNA ligase-1